MKLFRKLTYANVMATLALFLAVTGTAAAGVKYLESGSPAGGDLTGTLPNPALAANAGSTGQLADGAVTGAKVAAHSLTRANIDEATLGQVPDAATFGGGWAPNDFAKAARGYVEVDLPPVPAFSCISQLITMPQATGGDRIVVEAPGNLPHGLIVMPVWSAGPQTLEDVRICNVTPAALDAPNANWAYILLH